jgi:hypothetical protein
MAEVEGDEARGWLKDWNGRVVATGKGKTVKEAQQSAAETTTSVEARLHLNAMIYPDTPTPK